METRPQLETQRPPAWEEALASRLFLAISPRIGPRQTPRPPARLGPWATVHLPRSKGQGFLHGTWYPTQAQPRGVVLLAPPWQRYGQGYFHRRGRIQALRRAGYHSLTIDLPNFGTSGPPAGFFDRDLEDAADYLADRCPELPLHFWGVSSGGYWAHPFLARSRHVASAMFEDVAPHLMEWAWSTAPLARPAYLFFRTTFRRSYAFLDARRHAALLAGRPVTYVTGGDDTGIGADATLALAQRARAKVHVVAGARHLESIKHDRAGLIARALATFDRGGPPAQSRPRTSLAL